MVAPLKLKRQKTPRQKSDFIDQREVSGVTAEVLVDTPVSHLEQIYTYAVPTVLINTAIVGSIVQIEYGRITTKGLILRIREGQESKKNKSILSVIGLPGLIDQENLPHFNKVRDRFGGTLWNLLNSHLPPIPAKYTLPIEVGRFDSKQGRADKEIDFLKVADSIKITGRAPIKCAITPPIGIAKSQVLLEITKARFLLGTVLILVSDFQEFDYFKESLSAEFASALVCLDTREGREKRFESFLAANQNQRSVVLANRSGAFTRLPEGSTVIVVNDNDLSHYEQRAPGWNTRDVTLLRSEHTSLIFLNSYHSLEINRLISLGWMESFQSISKCRSTLHSSDSTSSYISLIKKGVKSGNVLVCVAEKGYANVFLCSKCKNLARCSCGGKLRIQKQNFSPSCYLCAKIVEQWRCQHCGNASPFVINRGIDRTAEEIGKAVNGVKIMISKKDQIASLDPSMNQVVISTRGSEPVALYATIVLLDCERIYNQATLRAEEEAKHQWFDLRTRVIDGGDLYISLANNHPATQQLLRGQSYNEEELRQREQSSLPPFFRTVLIRGESHELAKFAKNLKTEYSFLISSPIAIDELKSYLIVRAEIASAPVLVGLLDDVVKVQGVKGRSIFDIRFDTYNL